MKVELHLHTIRYSGCASASPAELMNRLVETGYQAAYITEHDAVWSEREIDQLQRGFPGMRVFPGLERTVGSDPFVHLVVLGTTDPGYLELTVLAEVLAKARDEGHLTVLAHPFRWEGTERMLESGHLPDALEYRTCNHDAGPARLAEAFARRYDLPLVNAGDTHALRSLNRFWLQTDRPLAQADDIREAVVSGAYENCLGETERW